MNSVRHNYGCKTLLIICSDQKLYIGSKSYELRREKTRYLCSENKGADQLRGYREADLRLCFGICKTLVFS